MIPASSPIDAAAFTALFSVPPSDLDGAAIATVVYRLSHDAARGFDWPTAEDREDAGSDAAVHCIARVDRFHPSRPGANAWQYFSTVAMNFLRGRWVSVRRRASHLVALDDIVGGRK